MLAWRTLAEHRMVWLLPTQPSAGRDIDGKVCRRRFELPCDLADLCEPTRRSRRERDIEGLVRSEKEQGWDVHGSPLRGGWSALSFACSWKKGE